MSHVGHALTNGLCEGQVAQVACVRLAPFGKRAVELYVHCADVPGLVKGFDGVMRREAVGAVDQKQVAYLMWDARQAARKGKRR